MSVKFTLVVSGKKDVQDSLLLNRDTKKRVQELLKNNRVGVKEIAVLLAGEKELNYRAVYKECLSLKNAIQQ